MSCDFWYLERWERRPSGTNISNYRQSFTDGEPSPCRLLIAMVMKVAKSFKVCKLEL